MSSERLGSRPLDYCAIGGETASVTRAVPAFFHRVPVYPALHMGAYGRNGKQRTLGVSVSSQRFALEFDYRGLARHELRQWHSFPVGDVVLDEGLHYRHIFLDHSL